MQPSPFPFIVGMPRSGTTLLRAMFDSHPDIAVPEEAQFRLHMCRNLSRYDFLGSLNLELFLSDLFRHPSFQRWIMKQGNLRDALIRHSPETVPDAIRAVFGFYATSFGKTRYGDKTPEAVMHLLNLAKLFPEARFIHLIRDGRDVALSHKDVPFGIDRVGEVAIHWKKHVKHGQDAGKSLGTQIYREVRYERLVEDPDATLRSLCHFVEVEYDESMLRHHERASSLFDNSRDPSAHKSVFKPATKGLRDWREQMTRRELEVFETLAGGLLEQLGYERAVASPRRRARLFARLLEGYNFGARRGNRLRRRFLSRVRRLPL